MWHAVGRTHGAVACTLGHLWRGRCVCVGCTTSTWIAWRPLYAQVAREVFGVPFALLGIFHTELMPFVEGMPPGKLPWRYNVCPWHLLAPRPTTLVVEDLANDARFSDKVGNIE